MALNHSQEIDNNKGFKRSTKYYLLFPILNFIFALALIILWDFVAGSISLNLLCFYFLLLPLIFLLNVIGSLASIATKIEHGERDEKNCLFIAFIFNAIFLALTLFLVKNFTM